MSSASAATAPAPAAAPATGSITTSIPCTVGGVASTCQLTVTSFKVVNGAIDAVGTVTGGGVTVPFHLGNILCAVANLLNNTGSTTTGLRQIVNLLNQILARL